MELAQDLDFVKSGGKVDEKGSRLPGSAFGRFWRRTFSRSTETTIEQMKVVFAKHLPHITLSTTDADVLQCRQKLVGTLERVAKWESIPETVDVAIAQLAKDKPKMLTDRRVTVVAQVQADREEREQRRVAGAAALDEQWAKATATRQPVQAPLAPAESVFSRIWSIFGNRFS